MGIEIIGLIAGLLALIPVILSALNNRKANRNALGRVESDELKKSMAEVDAVYAAAPDDPPRVQPPER